MWGVFYYVKKAIQIIYVCKKVIVVGVSLYTVSPYIAVPLLLIGW
jgi:hypothetical protein